MRRRANHRHWSAQPGPTQGDATRSSRNVGAGCDGRCGVRRVRSPGETSAAYGKVVWSWRRDRGVYPARLVAGSATVTKNAAHRGEHEVNRQTIARGKPGCLGCTCLIRVRFLSTIAHGAAGAVSARLSLRPLFRRGTRKSQNPGENHAAGTRTLVFLSRLSFRLNPVSIRNKY